MADLVPADLEEDQSSQTESVLFETAWYEFFAAPDDGVIEWRTFDDQTILVAEDNDFTKWTVDRKDPNVIVLDLNNGATVEIHGLGPARLQGARSRFTLPDVNDTGDQPPNTTAPLESPLRGVSDDTWDVTGGELTVQNGAAFLVYNGDDEKDDTAAVFNRLATSELQSGPSNITRLARTLQRGYLARVDQALTDLRGQLTPEDMTRGFLEQYARDWGILREKDESDARLRIRLKGKVKRLRGGTQPESIRSFVAAFLEGDDEDITLIENEDPDDQGYQGARLEVQFSTSLLRDLGFEAPFTDIVNDIDDILADTVAAGVFAQTDLLTAAEYGSGNLLDNGNFEDYPTSPGVPPDWENNTGASTTFRREESNVFDGTQAVEVEAAGGTSEEGLEQDVDGFTGGNQHTASVHVRTDGNAGELPKLIVRNLTDSTEEGSATGTDGGTSYEKISVTWTPEDGKNYVVELVHDGTPSSGDIVYFDEARVQDDDASAASYDDGDAYGS